MAVLFSTVTATADDQKVDFLVSGIPHKYEDLEGWRIFDNFLDGIDCPTNVSVHLYDHRCVHASPQNLLYLNTLTVGSHTLEIIWTDGSASTAFSVNAKSPQTGDNNMMWIWIALLFVSGIGVMGTTIYIRKKKYSVK